MMIISRLPFLSAKFIRFWIRPWDCMIRQTRSSLITSKLASSIFSNSLCLILSLFFMSTCLCPSNDPLSLSRLFKSQTISSISHEISRHLCVFSSGESLASQELRQRESPSLASTVLICRYFRNISSNVREVSEKRAAAFKYCFFWNKSSAQRPAAQEMFQFFALHTLQASLYFFSAISSFQASVASCDVSSLMTPLGSYIQNTPVFCSYEKSEASMPLKSSQCTIFWVTRLMMVRFSWNKMQQWKSVMPMLAGLSEIWQAVSMGRSTFLANLRMSFLLRKLSVIFSSWSGILKKWKLLPLVHRMVVGRPEIFEQHTLMKDITPRGIIVSFIFSLESLNFFSSTSRSSGPVTQNMEVTVASSTITYLPFCWLSLRISMADTSQGVEI